MQQGQATRAAVAEFAAELRALRMACGNPSYALLRRGSAVLPPATISDSLRGRVVPRLEFVVAFVQGCLRCAADRGMDVDPALTDLQAWRRRWLHLHHQIDGRQDESPGPAVDADPTPSGGQGQAIAGRHGAAPPWQLPPAVRRLDGRVPDIAWLDGIADASTDGEPDPNAQAQPRIVVLSGMGGVGKTALALSWGHRRRGQFPDGQLFADLGGYGPTGPVDPVHILTMFVRALGTPSSAIPGDLDGLSALFRSLCQDRRLLVILDNASSAGQVLPLLPATGAAMTIVTSRDLCNGLTVRADARRLIVRPLAPDEAVTMLTRDLPRLDVQRLRRLAEVCGNLPLALRLAASRLADDPSDRELTALIDRSATGITASSDLLTALSDPTDPYCDLASVLSWSTAHGTSAESRAIMLLAQSLGSSVDDHLAASLIGLPITPSRRILAALAARHLVQREPDGWRMHDVVHAWAREAAWRELGVQQCRDAQRRMLGHYLYTLDAMDRALLPQRGRAALSSSLPRPLAPVRWPDPAAALAWGDTALPVMTDVVALAIDLGEHDVAATIPHIMMSYLNLRKPWQAWIALCRAALAAERHVTSPEQIANLRVSAGIALRETDALPDAQSEFAAALEGYRQCGNMVGAAMTLNNLATCHQQAGEPRRARAALLESVRVLAGGDDEYRRAIVLHNLAEVDIDLGDLPGALDHARQALVAASAAGDSLGAATTRTTMGRIHLLQGEQDLAEGEFAAALSVQRSGGDAYGAATTAKHWGRMLLDTGRPAEAVAPLTEAARILADLGDPEAAEVAALVEDATEKSAVGPSDVR